MLAVIENHVVRKVSPLSMEYACDTIYREKTLLLQGARIQSGIYEKKSKHDFNSCLPRFINCKQLLDGKWSAWVLRGAVI